MAEKRTRNDPYCLCCCRPKSEHIGRDLQCPETVYFVENRAPVLHRPSPKATPNG